MSTTFDLNAKCNHRHAADKPECKRCAKALQELENIDDEADQLGIGFVKIHDTALAEEYNLGSLPALVYYRRQIPILFEGIQSRTFCLYTCQPFNLLDVAQASY